MSEAVVAKSLALKLPFVPGVMTASEVEHGLALGCKLQKFFPAEPAGGVKMLKALAGPYAHTGVKFIPLGGVNAGNMPWEKNLTSAGSRPKCWYASKKRRVAASFSGLVMT